jgi:hypothetical protein
LGAGSEAEVVGGEPVEEADGADDLVAGVVDGGAGCGVVLGLAAEAPQDPPGGEGGDNFAVLGPGDARDGVGVQVILSSDADMDLPAESARSVPRLRLTPVGGRPLSTG